MAPNQVTRYSPIGSMSTNRFGMITWMLLLGLALGIRKREEPLNSLIVEEAGVILKTKGMVTMTKENLLVSVFKKIDLPRIGKVDCARTVCSRSRGRFRCSNHSGARNLTRSGTHWTQQHLRDITANYVAEYE